MFTASIDEQVPTFDAGDNPWIANIPINGSLVESKIHTGADVSVISDTTYKALPKKTPLKTAKKSLMSASSQPLDVRGQFTGTIQHGSCTSSEDIFVVKNLQMSLLGRPDRIAETSLKGQHSGRPETALHAPRFVPRPRQDPREVPHPTEGGCPALCALHSKESSTTTCSLK